jgi:hypothetical protein
MPRRIRVPSYSSCIQSKKKNKTKQNKTMTWTRPMAIKETTGITNDALLELRHGVIMPRNKTKGAQR